MTEEPDALVCIFWDPDLKTFRIAGRVTLDPGVGTHLVDVTHPAAPCILRRPEWPELSMA